MTATGSIYRNDLAFDLYCEALGDDMVELDDDPREELGRLKLKLASLFADARDQRNQLQADINRLRDALQRIESCADDSSVMRDIAREALR